jgi:hypothetical protein
MQQLSDLSRLYDAEKKINGRKRHVHLFDDWFDPIETGIRDWVREFNGSSGECGHKP